MVVIGKVTGREIAKNRDGEEDVILLQVEVSDSDDIQTVELHRGAGVDLNPPDGSIVTLVNAGNAWQIAATTNDNVTPEGLDEGAYQIYASDSGSKTANALCEPGGDLVLNNGTDYAVQYTELKSAFDTLKGDLNILIALYNAHTHIIIGPVIPNTDIPLPAALFVPPTGSIADMSAAKVPSVRVTK